MKTVKSGTRIPSGHISFNRKVGLGLPGPSTGSIEVFPLPVVVCKRAANKKN